MDYLFLIICTLTVVLIIAHVVISRRKGDSENQGGKPGHWTYSVTLLISFLLLLIYIAGVGGVFYSNMSWPNVGSKANIFLFLFCPGILFQSFFLAYSLIKRKFPAKRIWIRLLSIVLGLFLSAQISKISSAMAMQRFEQACQPLVEMIQENLPQPCDPEISYSDLLPHKGENSMWYPGNRWHLWHNEKSFVLTFPGGSIDIDGSTIYYFSKQGGWTIFHNDSTEDSKQLQELLKGMEECQDRPAS